MKDSQNKTQRKRLFKKKKLNPKKPKRIAPSTPQKNERLFKIPSFFKKHEKDMFFSLLPLTLIVLFAIVYLINSNIVDKINRNKLAALSNNKLAAYPVLQNSTVPFISAKAAIILDSGSQTTLFSKNPSLRFSMASTVKIMTALVALDYYKLNSVLTIKSPFVEGSGLSLQKGDSFYFEDLLYAMLLPSANDAASAIADNYLGGRTAFVSKMNEKAAGLHLTDTHFSDPIGLNDDGDYSTVVDIARLSSVAIKNKEFANVVATSQKSISDITGTRKYYVYNLNKLLGINGVNGIKTGTTEGAGEVLVTSAVQNGHTFIVVVMNSQDRFGDTEMLLNFVSGNIQFLNPQTGTSN